MPVILMLMIVLTLMGAGAIYKVRSDIGFTFRDLRHYKAQAVAESAVNWAQEALEDPKRKDLLSYTVSTHAKNGTTALSGSSPAANPDKLYANEVARVYKSGNPAYVSGWISQSTTDASLSLTQSRSETIAFKVWYPTDTTIRITGKGTVEGVSAQVEMYGSLK